MLELQLVLHPDPDAEAHADIPEEPRVRRLPAPRPAHLLAQDVRLAHPVLRPGPHRCPPLQHL